MAGTQQAYQLLAGIIEGIIYNLDQLPETPEGCQMRELLLEMKRIAEETLGNQAEVIDS